MDSKRPERLQTTLFVHRFCVPDCSVSRMELRWQSRNDLSNPMDVHVLFVRVR